MIAAEKAADAAAAEVARLESMVANGDESVELDEIEAARRASRRSRLVAKGWIAIRDRPLKRRRKAQLEDYRRVIVEQIPARRSDVVAAFDDLVAANDRLVARVTEHNDAVRTISDELIDFLSSEESDLAGQDDLGEFVVHGSSIHVVKASHVRMEQLSFDELAAEGTRRALMGALASDITPVSEV